MKHIRLFEDYSDEELRDLMGDLETIGHKHQLVKGKDYGFGKYMNLENDGKTLMVFTDYAIGELVKAGIIKDNLSPLTKNQRFYIPNSSGEFPGISRIYFHIGYAKVVEILEGKRYAYLVNRETGREFPVEAKEKSMFIGANKVKKVYEILEKKIKDLRF
jgi:hypothetical protein